MQSERENDDGIAKHADNLDNDCHDAHPPHDDRGRDVRIRHCQRCHVVHCRGGGVQYHYVKTKKWE